MESHRDEGQAVSQDQTQVPSVPDQATLSFCQLVGWKEEFERGCEMEKRALTYLFH